MFSSSRMSLAKPQLIVHSEQSVDMTMYDCRWVPSSTRFVTMGTSLQGEGLICVYSMTGEGVKKQDEVRKPRPFKCGTFSASSLEERFLATGDFQGNLDVWDLESFSKPVFTVKGHTDFIGGIDGAGGLGGKGAPEIATGSRDGTVKVWDTRVKDKPVACMQPREFETRRDCWTVAFGNSHSESDRMIAAGYDNGDIKMFDLRTMSLHWETNVPNGVCALEFDRKDIEMNKLVATCLEGRVHVWDLRTKNSTKEYAMLNHKDMDDKSTIWNCKHLPQNRDIFMTMAGSGSLNLYKYNYPSNRVKEHDSGDNEGVMGSLSKLQTTAVGDQPISGFDWNADKCGLAVCVGFDQKIRIVIATKLNTY